MTFRALCAIACGAAAAVLVSIPAEAPQAVRGTSAMSAAPAPAVRIERTLVRIPVTIEAQPVPGKTPPRASVRLAAAWPRHEFPERGVLARAAKSVVGDGRV